MAEELKKFYKGRAKKPQLFDYDADGNLVEKNKEGEVIKTIPLPNYRKPTLEEYDEMEKKREEAIAVANKEFEDARKELREFYSRPDTPDSEIIRLNRKVTEADIKLQSVRFPLRYIELDFGIPIREIDFDKSYEKRKLPYYFYILKERPFTLQEQYVRVGKAPEKPLVSVAEAKAAEEAGVPVILFAEPDTNDYGFLSLKWSVELEFNGTMYHSAQQAMYAEIAKAFNDQTNLEKIMLAETPDEINYTVDDVPGDTETNEVKWNDLTKQLIYDINILKFNQYPELTARLLETKNASLGAYIPDDNLIGIGISIDNVQSQNPVNWTGQNLLGKALMNIRDKVRTERAIIAAQEIPEAPRPPRRRKPQLAQTVSQPSEPLAPVVETIAPEVQQTQELEQPVPRPIRRRPVIAPATTVAPMPTVDAETTF